jgi:hypothetical protein
MAPPPPPHKVSGSENFLSGPEPPAPAAQEIVFIGVILVQPELALISSGESNIGSSCARQMAGKKTA